MAQEDQHNIIDKHTDLNTKTFALADYEGDEYEFSVKTLFPIDRLSADKPERKKYGISIASIDKYIEPQTYEKETEDANYGEQLKGYTAAQWDNITQRKKLESPPLPKVSLPKIKFEKTLKD